MAAILSRPQCVNRAVIPYSWWVVTCLASSHYWKQRWVIFNSTLKNNLPWNLNQIWNIVIEIGFQHVVCNTKFWFFYCVKCNGTRGLMGYVWFASTGQCQHDGHKWIPYGDFMTWTYFPHYWPFVWWAHGSLSEPHTQGRQCETLIISFVAHPNKLLNKQSSCRWFGPPRCVCALYWLKCNGTGSYELMTQFKSCSKGNGIWLVCVNRLTSARWSQVGVKPSATAMLIPKGETLNI